MIVTLDAKRRLTIPAVLAPAKPGDYFDARFDAEEDTLTFRRLAGKENWLSVLKACPVSLDDLPPRRLAGWQMTSVSSSQLKACAAGQVRGDAAVHRPD
jgi:hypothetical protein